MRTGLRFGMPEVSVPALWGKLPTHADYLQHRVRAGEAQAWRRWLAEELPAATSSPDTRMAAPGGNWVALDPPPRPTPLHGIPIAFVLPPGALSFAPQHHVFGVLAPSRDRLGRTHPILIYQCVHIRWLERLFETRATQAGDVFQQWPFALARLLARYVQNEESCDASPIAPAGSHPLSGTVEQLWTLFAPGRLQWLGIHRGAPTSSAVLAVLKQAPMPQEDAAAALRGMDRLPWADWPQRLWAARPQSAFWQQDSQGGYIGASLRLRELWRKP